jgi:hypothetical protein
MQFFTNHRQPDISTYAMDDGMDDFAQPDSSPSPPKGSHGRAQENVDMEVGNGGLMDFDSSSPPKAARRRAQEDVDMEDDIAQGMVDVELGDEEEKEEEEPIKKRKKTGKEKAKDRKPGKRLKVLRERSRGLHVFCWLIFTNHHASNTPRGTAWSSTQVQTTRMVASRESCL